MHAVKPYPFKWFLSEPSVFLNIFQLLCRNAASLVVNERSCAHPVRAISVSQPACRSSRGSLCANSESGEGREGKTQKHCTWCRCVCCTPRLLLVVLFYHVYNHVVWSSAKRLKWSACHWFHIFLGHITTQSAGTYGAHKCIVYTSFWVPQVGILPSREDLQCCRRFSGINELPSNDQSRCKLGTDALWSLPYLYLAHSWVLATFLTLVT